MREWPLFRLSPLQFLFIALLSLWPHLAHFAARATDWVAWLPIVIFMPLAYLLASSLAALAHGAPVGYAVGLSLAIFAQAYLILVSWRQRRARR
jgi:hypothetical protein